MRIGNSPEFLQQQTHRWRKDPTKGLDLLVDAAGFLYVKELLGEEDCGPYILEEIVMLFDVEATPVRTHILPKSG